MSRKNNQCKLKAGHPPAAKAGKMRITQHKHLYNSNDYSSGTADDACILNISSSLPKITTISGARIHGHSDYPTEAVKKFHEKPFLTHLHKCNSFKPIIHQPKK